MFEKAVRMKLRFNYTGLLSVEDLWDLSVSSLDQIFKSLNAQLKAQKEESLLDVKTEEEDGLALKVQIIKHIVKTKLDEADAIETKVLKAEKKQKLLKVISEKKEKVLYDMPVDELEKLVNDLD